MRSTYGAGKPRAAHDAAVGAILKILAIMMAIEDHFPPWFADSDNEVEIRALSAALAVGPKTPCLDTGC